MNADPADTRHPHLELEDLIARAAGQPVTDRARAHLASCEHCQREADRWNLVADGVRLLAGTEPETAPPARPRRVLTAAPWRRALLVAGSAAAALVLLVGAGEAAGVVHLSFGKGGGTGTGGTGTSLTAVTGCSQIREAAGTLEQVSGTSLVIKTASGQPVTVTTTASTFLSMSGALLGDITDGASVMVRGTTANGILNAAIVKIGEPFSAVNPAGSVPVQGTVADAHTGGFTLEATSGTRIPVTTSGETLVIIPHARPDQLPPGITVFALGQAEPDGTLSAKAVAALAQLRSGARISVSTKVKNCSPSSIDEALGAIAATPVHG